MNSNISCLYESAILEQQVNYFILENKYMDLCNKVIIEASDDKISKFKKFAIEKLKKIKEIINKNKTAKVSSQEELYKAVEASINSVSKEYRKVADKQSKINKELQMQLERADRKANNENASIYDKILNDTIYS